jgi:ABC-type multidrug transport system fused ATPase/permease subunit
VQQGTTRTTVDRVALLLAAFVVLQTVLTRWSHWLSLVLAERVFAGLREEFLERVVDLPLSTVESAGSGDLLTRMTSDVDQLARTVRYAVPEVAIALLTTVLTVAAAFVAGPQVAVAALVVVPPLWLSTRWYLRRAPDGYLRERATYSQMNGGLTETVTGARTVEALGLQERRVQRGDEDIRRAYLAERYTLKLRCIWFPVVDASFALPVVAVLGLGGVLVAHGHASLGQVTAVTLYVRQLIDPLDRLLGWLDELQVGATSMARLVGVTAVPVTGTRRTGSRRTSGCGRRTCGSPTSRGGTCCTGSTWTSVPASGSRSSARAARASPREPAARGHPRTAYRPRRPRWRAAAGAAARPPAA